MCARNGAVLKRRQVEAGANDLHAFSRILREREPSVHETSPNVDYAQRMVTAIGAPRWWIVNGEFSFLLLHMLAAQGATMQLLCRDSRA